MLFATACSNGGEESTANRVPLLSQPTEGDCPEGQQKVCSLIAGAAEEECRCWDGSFVPEDECEGSVTTIPYTEAAFDISTNHSEDNNPATIDPESCPDDYAVACAAIYPPTDDLCGCVLIPSDKEEGEVCLGESEPGEAPSSP